MSLEGGDSQANEADGDTSGADDLRSQIIGMGNVSMRKNYYSALKRRLDELERYKELMDKAHDGIFVLDLPEFRFSYVNTAVSECFGYSKEEFLTKRFDEVFPEDIFEQLKLWQEDEDLSVAQHLSVSLDNDNAQVDSNHLELSLSTDFNGKQRCIFGLVRDISAIYKMNKDLERTERVLHSIFDNSFQFAGLLDSEGRVVIVNETALSVIEGKQEDVRGLYFWDTPWWSNSKDNQRQLKDAFLRCLNGEMIRYETTHPTSTGETIYVDFSMKPVFGGDGEVVNLVVEGRDITTIKRLESQLLHSQKMDSIGQLAGGVAHDFNNLLGGIIGAVDLLLSDGSLGDEQRDLLTLVQGASESASELTHKLLSFSRKDKVLSSPVDIHNIVSESVMILKRSIDKRIELEINLNSEQHTIIGDPTQLESAILNLGVNARDAMPSGGKISITSRERYLDEHYCEASQFQVTPGNFICIDFSDTGCGIPESNLPKLFEPFFTTKGVGKGTGLGLATVYGAIYSHKGCIEVRSVVGEGTMFSLYFPLHKTSDSSRSFVANVNDEKGSGLVLLVDDEPILRTTCSMMLESMGFDVLTAEDGLEGVEAYRENNENIKVVIMDMVMPKLNGDEAIREMLKINPDIYIIVSSGFNKTFSSRSELSKRVSAFLHKPYRMHELRAALKKIGVVS